MSWNPEDFSDYSLTEYSQPAEAKKVEYTDPHFYHHGPGSQTPSSDTTPLRPPATVEYPPVPKIYQAAPIHEYTGLASIENYTTDVGAPPQEAVQENAGRKSGLAELGGLGAVLGIFFKFGLASVSALVSVAVYAQLFGWSFGLGLVVLLFIHEMGHAVVMKLKGIPIGALVFIPMLGAAVSMRRMPSSAKDEAEVGIAGPVAGAMASLACLFIALSTVNSAGHAGIWAPLAYFGFFLNLFNLIPIVPFDGGRVMAAIDRRVWMVGFVALLAIQIWQWFTGTGSIWLFIFIVMAATNFWTRRGMAQTPEARQYYMVARVERIIIGLAYFGLIAVLVLGMTAAHGLMGFAG